MSATEEEFPDDLFDEPAQKTFAVTYTWVVECEDEEYVPGAVREYVNSAGWAFDDPDKIEEIQG